MDCACDNYAVVQYLLYCILHVYSVWRQEEIAYINETTTGAERKAALYCLLEQEAQLIASIGRHKIVANEENNASGAKRFLNKVQKLLAYTALHACVYNMTVGCTVSFFCVFFGGAYYFFLLRCCIAMYVSNSYLLTSVLLLYHCFVQAAAPRRWTAFDGGITEMNTPYTLRAEQLRDIYSTLVMQNLSQDERLDVLLTLKSTVKVSASIQCSCILHYSKEKYDYIAGT